MVKQNWFPTLNSTLEAENLSDSWVCLWPSIDYGETRRYQFINDKGELITVSIYRNDNGLYERPVNYVAASAAYVKRHHLVV